MDSHRIVASDCYKPRSEKWEYLPNFNTYQELRAAIRELKACIRNDDLNGLEKLLKQNTYLLLNYPLDNNGSSAAIMAAKNKSLDVLDFIYQLLTPEQLNFKDNNSKSSADYLDRFLRKKDMKLPIAKHHSFLDPLIALLQSTIKDWNENVSSITTSDIDLFYTLSSVVELLNIVNSEAELKLKLQEFFNVRAEVLRNDAYDYCYGQTPANLFCCQLVELLFPEVKVPANLFYHQAMTAGRQTPWFDFISDEKSLPENPFSYFRTSDDLIHSYADIVDHAITQLKNGHTNLASVWRGTDLKKLTTTVLTAGESKEVNTNFAPLTAADLNVLERRTETLGKLVRYSKCLQTLSNELNLKATRSQKGNLYERFSRLRQALLAGDAQHAGTETNSGAEANVGIAEFAEWWNALGQTKNGLDLQKQLRGIPSLGTVLDIILDSNYGDHRLGTSYCISIKGGMLDDIIVKPDVQKRFYEIEGSINPRVSDSELLQWQADITKELEQPLPKQLVSNSIFKELRKNFSFLVYCISEKKLDYAKLINIRPVLAIVNDAKNESLTSVNYSNIFKINDLDHLEFLDDYFLYKRNWLSFVVGLRYEMLRIEDSRFKKSDQFEKKCGNYWNHYCKTHHIIALITSLIKSNNIDAIKFILSRLENEPKILGDINYMEYFDVACENGKLDLAMFLFEKINVNKIDAIKLIESSILNELLPIIVKSKELVDSIYLAAISKAKFDVIEYLLNENHIPIDIALPMLLDKPSNEDDASAWTRLLENLLVRHSNIDFSDHLLRLAHDENWVPIQLHLRHRNVSSLHLIQLIAATIKYEKYYVFEELLVLAKKENLTVESLATVATPEIGSLWRIPIENNRFCLARLDGISGTRAKFISSDQQVYRMDWTEEYIYCSSKATGPASDMKFMFPKFLWPILVNCEDYRFATRLLEHHLINANDPLLVEFYSEIDTDDFILILREAGIDKFSSDSLLQLFNKAIAVDDPDLVRYLLPIVPLTVDHLFLATSKTMIDLVYEPTLNEQYKNKFMSDGTNLKNVVKNFLFKTLKDMHWDFSKPVYEEEKNVSSVPETIPPTTQQRRSGMWDRALRFFGGTQDAQEYLPHVDGSFRSYRPK